MTRFNRLLSSVPKLERWIIEDKVIVTLNKINRSRFKRNEFKFVTEEDVKSMLIKYMKSNGIIDLHKGAEDFKRDVARRILEGEYI